MSLLVLNPSSFHLSPFHVVLCCCFKAMSLVRLSKSLLHFFLVVYAILKDFFTCLMRNPVVQNFTSDVMTIDQ